MFFYQFNEILMKYLYNLQFVSKLEKGYYEF
jgi:hypothetical protein